MLSDLYKASGPKIICPPSKKLHINLTSFFLSPISQLLPLNPLLLLRRHGPQSAKRLPLTTMMYANPRACRRLRPSFPKKNPKPTRLSWTRMMSTARVRRAADALLSMAPMIDPRMNHPDSLMFPPKPTYPGRRCTALRPLNH